MALDADFMVRIMQIPYFKQLADTRGQDWLESVFESLETRSYDFADSALPVAPESSEKRSNATTNSAEDLPGDAQVAAGSSAVDDAADGEASNPVNFDNDANRPSALYYTPSDDHWTNTRNSLFYSARGEEGVKVGLLGLQQELILSRYDDKIYTANLVGEHSTTEVRGGEGTDTLYLTKGGLTARLGGMNNFGDVGGKVLLKSVENVVGSDGDDTIFGSSGDNSLVGGSGDDKIDGGGGDDIVSGGSGDNTLTGGAGNDTFTSSGGDDVIDGGSGNDNIKSGTGSDEISAGDGDDTIDASNGDDTIDGGKGNDTITAGEGDDEVTGGDGDDTVKADAGNDTVAGGAGKDTIHGDDGNDTLKGDDGADKLFGDAGNDTIDGGADDDEITAGDGDDFVTGGAGTDTLLGNAGKDKIDGGDGADKITGGAGADTLTGGAGADIFIYTSKTDSGTAADSFDIITDFDVANDKFDLTAVLANDVFDFISAEGGAFTGTGPEVRWDQDGGKTLIEIDTDGNGTADMKIELDDLVSLTAANFNL